MLREVLVSCARHPQLRSAARWAFRVPAVGAGIRKVAESIIPPDERVWVQIPAGNAAGLWMKVLPKWEPGYLSGCAEEGMDEAVARLLRSGDCFYDVGAHVGYYSLMAGRIVGPAGGVVSFEPDPENAGIIAENASKNNLHWVTVVRAAMSDREGVVQFQLSGRNDMSRMSGMIVADAVGGPGTEVQTCPALSLDSYCSTHRPPALVKIDVEGAELAVLQGARVLLKERRPALIIEVHGAHLIPAVRSFLHDYGYGLEPIVVKDGQPASRNFLATFAV